MNKTRLEAFSDGVLAIIITIMVLELRPPTLTNWHALKDLIPVFICYLLSFVYIGIYWGNHHHLLHTVKKVDSGILWANMHLLFWLSLIPFATSWMGENCFQPVPVATYAILLSCCATAYFILQKTIQKDQSHFTLSVKKAIYRQTFKGMISLAGYLISVIFAFYYPVISEIIFFMIALIWIIPDPNIEKAINESES